MRTRSFIILLSVCVLPVPAEEIELTIEDRTGLGRDSEFVCGGIPLRRGALKEPYVSLTDSRGREMRSFARPLARWPDGSIKWLQLQTQVSLAPEVKGSAILKLGRPSSSVSSPWQEAEGEGTLEISNGILSVVFCSVGTEFIKSLSASGKEILRADEEPQMVFAVDRVGPGKTAEENWLREAKRDTKLEPAHGVIESFDVEEKTPFRFVARYGGGIVDEGGERKCSFVLRYYLFRNSRRVKIEWTLIWDCNPDTNFMRMCGMRFPADLSAASARFTESGASPKVGFEEEISLVATKQDARVHHIRRSQVRPVEVTFWQDADVQRSMIGAGTQDSGWVDVKTDSLSFTVVGHRFAQRFPKEIAVTEREVTYYLWPQSTGQLLDLRNCRIDREEEPEPDEGLEQETVLGRAPGIATTERIWLDFSGNTVGENLKACSESRLLLKASPQHYVGTGVFGPIHAYDPGLFPEYEGANEAILYWLLRSPEEFKWYGLINDGGSLMHFDWAREGGRSPVRQTWLCRGPLGWSMDDGAASWTMLLSWLRTSNDDYFGFAERAMNHAIDVSCVHSETEASIEVNNDGRPTVGGARWHNAQPWGDFVSSRGANAYGKFFFYYLTGEPRYLDVIAEGLYFEWLHSSHENWTSVGSLALGYELLDELKRSDPQFDTKHQQRLKRLSLMHERADKAGWGKCAAAASAYLSVERRGLANPPALLQRAQELLHTKLSPESLEPLADSVITEGVHYYGLVHDPASTEAKFARDFIRSTAGAALSSEENSGDRFLRGRSIGLAHAADPDPRYVAWVSRSLREMLPQEQSGPASFAAGLKDRKPSQLDTFDIWRRIAAFDAIAPRKSTRLYGMVVARIPYFLGMLEAEARAAILAAKKTELEIEAIPLVKGVKVIWAGELAHKVVGFEVHRKQGKDGELELAQAFQERSATVFLDHDLEPGVEYFYVLKVVDTDGKTTPVEPQLSTKPLAFVRRINCGGQEAPSADGVSWEKDRDRIRNTGIWSSRRNVIGADRMQDVYRTERWARSELKYDLKIDPGQYRLTLHFAEINPNFGVKGKRVFEILINGSKVAGPVDVFAEAGSNTAWQFTTPVESKDGTIAVALRKKAGAGPAMKGIEIFSLGEN